MLRKQKTGRQSNSQGHKPITISPKNALGRCTRAPCQPGRSCPSLEFWRYEKKPKFPLVSFSFTVPRQLSYSPDAELHKAHNAAMFQGLLFLLLSSLHGPRSKVSTFVCLWACVWAHVRSPFYTCTCGSWLHVPLILSSQFYFLSF